MLFGTFTFFIFFAVFYGLYNSLREHYKIQNLLILIGSYIFYGWWDERFLLLIALSTACDYIAGQGASGLRYAHAHRQKAFYLVALTAFSVSAINFSENWKWALTALLFIPLAAGLINALDKLSGPVRRKAYLTFSICFNLGLLAIFKYFGFFVDSLLDVTALYGLKIEAPLLHIILPVGISFYTFQTMSYSIDIYRKQMQPTDRIIDFAAYVAFFPQLVAGPIERAKNLLPQFQQKRKFTSQRLGSGSLLFLWGLFKKVVIADNISVIADMAFAAPEQSSPTLMLTGVIAFAFQIYCDFSAYSDMARGTARILGFDLMLNFNLPYLSRTPSEFWRRWHISLSTWLRDYLYIPLGGNKGSRLLTYRNLALTMLLGGLWHGAAWTFIAWGAFHGAILAFYRLLGVDTFLSKHRDNGLETRTINLIAWALMFWLTLIGWTLFRAETLSDAFIAMSLMTQAIISGQIFIQLPQLEQWAQLWFYIWPLLVVQTLQTLTGKLEFYNDLFTSSQHHLVRNFVGLNAALFLICGVLFLGAESGQQFIYFDF
ncbi:MAG: MBOAT family O-acyltransferase [bacterium]